MLHSASRKVLVPALLWCACQFAAAQTPAPAPVAPLTFAPLEPTLTPYLVQHKLPALAAAVVQDGRIIAAGAVGTRKVGSGIAVTVNDRFHIGSDTKAFTATLAGILVDRGAMAWTTTLGEAFPELSPKMDPDFRRITISQLLSHTAGIPADNAEFLELLAKSMFEEGNLDDLRYWTVQQWMSKPLPVQPGQRFAYSNLGYTIAGAMIERVARKSWEELINEWIFDPMELKSAGLGSQATLGRVDAALGHVLVGEDIAKPFMAGPGDDNPQLIAPAGGANMSVLDFARWAGWNAGEGKRSPALLKPGTLKLLHAGDRHAACAESCAWYADRRQVRAWLGDGEDGLGAAAAGVPRRLEPEEPGAHLAQPGKGFCHRRDDQHRQPGSQRCLVRGGGEIVPAVRALTA